MVGGLSVAIYATFRRCLTQGRRAGCRSDNCSEGLAVDEMRRPRQPSKSWFSAAGRRCCAGERDRDIFRGNQPETLVDRKPLGRACRESSREKRSAFQTDQLENRLVHRGIATPQLIVKWDH